MSTVMTAPPHNKKLPARKFVLLPLLLVAAAAGAFALLRPPPPAAEISPPPTAAPTVPPAVLAWVASGAAPGQHNPQQPGQLVPIGSAGVEAPILDVPPPASRIVACAASPDGSALVFYAGGDSGSLYLQQGMNPPVMLDTVGALACLGEGQVKFSPDGRQFGYIAYAPAAPQGEFADGSLRVVDTASAQRLLEGENATAFDLTAGSVIYASLYTNHRNEADEVAITTWDGTTRREAVTLRPTGEDCRFVSSQVAASPDVRIALVLGERCRSGENRTRWQLYTIDTAAGSATLAATDFQVGAFVPFARTNTLLFSPDGGTVFFTVPDGVTTNTVGVKSLHLADFAISDVIARQAIMPAFGRATNAFPQASPDGRWLALVVTTPDGANTLNVLDLATPSVAPITLAAGSRGDVVSALAFAADSRLLYAVLGGVDTAGNSLFAVDLTTGSSRRVARGHFGTALVVLPTGEIAVPDWQVSAEAQSPAYLNTVVINPTTGAAATWFAGADIVDGKVNNRRFALPLASR